MENGIVVKEYLELTLDELYELLRLRSKVFVVEQSCPYQDLDGLDRISAHLFIPREDGSVTVCARVYELPDEPRSFVIGRVVNDERGKGYGLRILEAAIEECARRGAKLIRLHAQQYAVGFYEKGGFFVCSEPFLEDGIPHVLMERKTGL